VASANESIFTQFVVGPAQTIGKSDKLAYFPDLEQIAGTTPSLTRFRSLVASAPDLETLRKAFDDPPELPDSAILAASHPVLASALDALDASDWAGAVAALKDAGRDLKELAHLLDAIHATIIAGLLGIADARATALALALMKAAWARHMLADPAFEGSPEAYLARFWDAGAPVVPHRLPRSRQSAWSKAGPDADPEPDGDGPAEPAGPQPADLEAAVRELERLRALQASADAAGPEPVRPVIADLSRNRSLVGRLFGARSPARMPRPLPAVAQRARPLDPEIRARIAPAASQTLAAQGIALDRIGVDSAISQLRSDLSKIYTRYAHLGPRIRETMFLQGWVVEVDTRVFAEISCPPKEIPCYCNLLSQLDAKHLGRSYVHVLGNGRAYRIDQTRLPYEVGALVHTEPVLGGSEKKASFRKLDRLEEREETETEREAFEETEATSHDQFSLANEVTKVSEKELNLSTGSNMTASYGGSISVSASFDASSTVGSKLSERTAANSAKEVINKAVKRIRERVQTNRSTFRLTETRRRDSFSVKAPNGSFTGFYQAIDEIYSNQLMCLKETLVIRISMGQPMAFLLASLAASRAEGVRLSKPVPPWEPHPDLGRLQSFGDITLDNYAAWAALYEVKGLKPPPGLLTASMEFGADFPQGGRPGGIWPGGSKSIDIPDGYEGVGIDVRGVMSDSYYVEGYVGNRYFVTPAGTSASLAPPVTGKVPIAYRGHTDEYGVTIVVHCQPMASTVAAWKISVHEAILEAYRRKNDAYEAEVQAAMASGGISIEGQNPLKNRQLVEQELQKFVLGALYPPFYYRGFDSMKFGAPCNGREKDLSRPIPEPDFSDAYEECPWVTFLTQAFEWRNMVYQFHPYYMAQRGHWVTLRGLKDNDPFFENAMSAGQVIIDVPVASHMTQPLLWFLQTGEIWGGGPLPVFGDPHFIDIVTAIRLSETGGDAVPSTEVAPWITKVPTPLVYVTDTPPPNLV
jgi:hypothetical protein